MKLKIIIAAFLLSLTVSAAADFKTIREGYEVAIGNVRLPQSKSGTIAYKKCSECPYETKRMASDATWVINGKATTLEKFRRRVSALDKRSAKIMTVGHHLERDEIVRVTIWIHDAVDKS